MTEPVDPPSGAAGLPTRVPIVRGRGVTETERHLAKLAEQSFLDLWCYPNLYRSQKLRGEGDGKELCDLLVVCGKHIIIFSEKCISWSAADVPVAWARWCKRAIKNAVDQLAGAERWIAEFSDRIYLDKDCTQPFPISFPVPEERIVHRIVVARGAGEACRKFFNGGTGSFIIDPSVKGPCHWSSKERPVQPFVVGDIDPDGGFVHVLDDASLDVVLDELDTISDFANYLQKKEEFIRSGLLARACGEEDLLAYYMVQTKEDGSHVFVPQNDGGGAGDQPITIDCSHYPTLLKNPQYRAKKDADQISYLWDGLITNFTEHMLGGTSQVPDGVEYDLRNSEKAIRYMALEDRLHRRAHGVAVDGAMRQGAVADRFFRAMVKRGGQQGCETGFFFLTLKYLDWMEPLGGYEHYRLKRQELMTAYAQGLLLRYSYLRRVVGVAVEPPAQGGGSSEDLIYIERGEWTKEFEAAVTEQSRRLNIFQQGFEEREYRDQEFPFVGSVPGQAPPKKKKFTRKERKARQKRRQKQADRERRRARREGGE
ncbi:MAG: hypothetical protein R3B94_03190 [Hyphomonas sp.]